MTALTYRTWLFWFFAVLRPSPPQALRIGSTGCRPVFYRLRKFSRTLCLQRLPSPFYCHGFQNALQHSPADIRYSTPSVAFGTKCYVAATHTRVRYTFVLQAVCGRTLNVTHTFASVPFPPLNVGTDGRFILLYSSCVATRRALLQDSRVRGSGLNDLVWTYHFRRAHGST